MVKELLMNKLTDFATGLVFVSLGAKVSKVQCHCKFKFDFQGCGFYIEHT